MQAAVSPLTWQTVRQRGLAAQLELFAPQHV
jgi:hypothetical protein